MPVSPARRLARQCSLRVACLSLYIDISLIILQPPQYISKNECRPALLPPQTDQHTPALQASNIVQSLGHRSLTGRGLGITVQQHYGYRMHYELRGVYGSRAFERRFPSYESCSQLCVDMVRGFPEGLCNCVLMREYLDVYGTPEYAGRYGCVGAMTNIVFACHCLVTPNDTSDG